MFGHKRNDYVKIAVLLVTLDTVRAYAPGGLTTTPNGGVTLDGSTIARSLFPSVRPEHMEECIKGGALAYSLPIQGRPWPTSAHDALGTVLQSLIGGTPVSELNDLTFYTLESTTRDSWFVIAGRLASPPSGATVQRFKFFVRGDRVLVESA